MNPVISFKIPVIDMDRAMKFYSQTFGYKLAQAIGANNSNYCFAIFPYKTNKEGIAGSLIKSGSQKPVSDGITICFSCENIDETLKKVIKNGGFIIETYGSFATIKDTEGNIINVQDINDPDTI